MYKIDLILEDIIAKEFISRLNSWFVLRLMGCWLHLSREKIPSTHTYVCLLYRQQLY